VLELNSNIIKDQVYAMLGRDIPNGGMVNFPDWLEAWYYSELTAENRNPKGEWECPRGVRNESWDLLCYALAVALSNTHARLEHIDWEAPPSWAEEWDMNDLVFMPDEADLPFTAPVESRFSLAELGEALG
jgi:phage terminase large subunit GpA-like protein